MAHFLELPRWTPAGCGTPVPVLLLAVTLAAAGSVGPAHAQDATLPPATAPADAVRGETAPGEVPAVDAPAVEAPPAGLQIEAPQMGAPAPEAATDLPAAPGAEQSAPALPDGAAVAPTDVAPTQTVPTEAAPATGPATALPEATAPAENASTPGSPLPHELSPWGMFMAADIVVKAVMVGLAFAAFVTWTILLFKLVEVAAARRAAGRAAVTMRDADSLAAAAASLGQRRDPGSFMARAALEEFDRSIDMVDAAGPAGVKERVRSILDRTELQAGRRLMRGTGMLATIGSTAPFVGLFGTVWGIMNSFIGISRSQTTNLAVVAPGIAEALLATAIGLVAAIPAVIVYNHFARAIAGYRLVLGDAGAGVERLLSRDLDRRKAGIAPRVVSPVRAGRGA